MKGWGGSRAPTDRPGAGGHGRRGDLVDPEHFERGDGADDIDDGIVPPDLVEVHLRRPGAGATPTSTSASRRKTASARSATRGGSAASVISPTMSAWVRTTASVAPPHQGPRARHATSERLLDLELPAGEGEPSQEEADLFDVRSRIDEGAQGHVAAMPAKQWNQAIVAADPAAGGGRRSAHGSSRAMAQAAP